MASFLIPKTHLATRQVRRIIELFDLEVPASRAANLVGVNRHTTERLYKLISVDLVSQHLTYSLGGKTLEQFAISGGLPRTPTPVGDFNVITKRDTVHYRGVGFDYPNTKWNLRFAWGRGFSYYIHGAWWHNDFGAPRSHGCVNVAYDNMERLYTWAQVGTKVVISS